MDPKGIAALVAGAGWELNETLARNLTREGSRIGILGRETACADAGARDIDGFAYACDVGISMNL